MVINFKEMSLAVQSIKENSDKLSQLIEQRKETGFYGRNNDSLQEDIENFMSQCQTLKVKIAQNLQMMPGEVPDIDMAIVGKEKT